MLLGCWESLICKHQISALNLLSGFPLVEHMLGCGGGVVLGAKVANVSGDLPGRTNNVIPGKSTDYTANDGLERYTLPLMSEIKEK